MCIFYGIHLHNINSHTASAPPALQLKSKLYQTSSLMFSAAVFVDMYNPGAKDVVDMPPPMQMLAPPPIAPPPIAPPTTPSIDELIQQSQWNLQQQEQHMHTLRQVPTNRDTKNISGICFLAVKKSFN